MRISPPVGGLVSAAALLALSVWSLFGTAFGQLWVYSAVLALGFGTQVGLYLYLRQLTAAHQHGGGAVATSGATSTAAMLACCTHYLVNVLPVLGTVGLVTLLAQYQMQLFWIALAANATGLIYIGRQVAQARNHFLGTHAC